jgi:hypothetical protein
VRKKLSIGQLKRISEILGNISVAWFSAGVIAPLFARSKNWREVMLTIFLSLSMATSFFVWSLFLEGRTK